MANSIALAQKYIPFIDEVYAKETTSSVLENPALVGGFVGANTVQILSVATQLLGDYGRNTGYVDGDITATWEAHTLTQDRGRRFVLDTMDNEETLGLTLGASMSEFMRVGPAKEIDAYRYATLAAAAGNTATEAVLTASTTKEAIDLGMTTMEELEVPLDGGWLFVTPTVLNYLESSDFFTYNVNADQNQARGMAIGTYRGLSVIKVPQSRFFTQINLNDGTTSGQENGGFVKTPTTGRDINFMIVARNAAFPVVKHNPSNIINPDANQTADGYIMKYRLYHDIFVPANKTDGIYLHPKTS